MKKRQRNRVISLVVIVLALGLGVFAAVWGGFFSQKSQAQDFSPHYFVYEGIQTRIFMASETSSYSIANQTYVSSGGITVANGSGLFTINLTLRNDYSSDNPPPNMGTPIAPIDGTAYIRVQPILFDANNNLIPSVNTSPNNFPSPAGQTGLVLASGQTVNVQLSVATYQNSISSYVVNLMSISDSIQS